MSSFSVVEFVDEVDSDGCKKVDIVPSEWFHGTERKLCWWPPASLVNVTKAVKEGTPPASNWTLCNVRVMGNPATYANAKAKLHQSEYSSELMDNDNGMRKRKPSVKLMQSQLSSHTESSEPSDSDEELPPTPPEQLLKRPSGKNNSVVASPRSAARSATRAVAASPAAWSAASPTCEAMFSKVLAVLEEVKKTQLVHSKMLNALLKQKNGSVAEVPERVVLPLKTQDDVEALNGRLEDCSLMSDVTTANIDITITMVGASHTVGVNPQDTVGSLKIKIQSMLGVDPQRQRLVFINGQKTPLNDDSKPISYYGLQHGSQVSLLVTEPPPAPTQVFLRNVKGHSSTYDIQPGETVSNFKNRVEKREGVPASQQRLIHQGREMQGGKLEDYNVRNHSTIYMILRLRGG
uniref:Polyubiquitin-B-like n=1 Tax=Oreochromis niloticus TaxID=8128 RepID=A0A669D3U9_ORENI